MKKSFKDLKVHNSSFDLGDPDFINEKGVKWWLMDKDLENKLTIWRIVETTGEKSFLLFHKNKIVDAGTNIIEIADKKDLYLAIKKFAKKRK